MATEATSVDTLKDAKLAETQKVADKTNSERTGKGTRVRVGQTRGKNPQVITWEAFDESKPETCPTTPAEFMSITGVKEDKALVALLIDGYNSAQYTAASDPIAEYVEPTWDEDLQKQFRLAVRNYSNATGASIEDSVNLIKPGIVASLAKKANG
jgi:hypothetical protein